MAYLSSKSLYSDPRKNSWVFSTKQTRGKIFSRLYSKTRGEPIAEGNVYASYVKLSSIFFLETSPGVLSTMFY